MSVESTKFLNVYKDYETLVRSTGKDPKELEDQMPELEANRMRMCRQFRNYLSHVNDPGFIEPTEKMAKFLLAQAAKQRMAGDVAKKHLKKPSVAVIDGNMKLSEAVKQVLPLRRELVAGTLDGKYVVYSLFDLTKAALEQPKTTKVQTVKPLRTKPVLVAPDVAVSELDSYAVYVCTEDGTAEGKLLGLVIL